MVYESFEAVQERRAGLRAQQRRFRFSREARRDARIVGAILACLVVESLVVVVLVRLIFGPIAVLAR